MTRPPLPPGFRPVLVRLLAEHIARAERTGETIAARVRRALDVLAALEDRAGPRELRRSGRKA